MLKWVPPFLVETFVATLQMVNSVRAPGRYCPFLVRYISRYFKISQTGAETVSPTDKTVTYHGWSDLKWFNGHAVVQSGVG